MIRVKGGIRLRLIGARGAVIKRLCRHTVDFHTADGLRLCRRRWLLGFLLLALFK